MARRIGSRLDGLAAGPTLRGLRDLRDQWWLLVALLVGATVGISYLLTHPYPAYGAGLYLSAAQEIVAGGYRLPDTIPHYTAGGVPFAYPPLALYAAAVVLDFTALTPLALSRYGPVVLTVAHVVPYYFLARELLDDRAEAGIATVFFVVAPPVLQWHLSAGGIVRSTAFLFTLLGAYTGVRLFRGYSRWWVLPSTLLFGLTVLTHPVYTVFFGVSYLVFFVAFDRTIGGLLAGAVVAVGGVALAAPWWLRVLETHGLAPFTAAAGTHTGLFGGTHRLVDQFIYPLVTGPPVPLYFLLVFAGLFYFLGRRRFTLPVWLVAGAFVLGKERFQFVAGSMMVASLLMTAVPAVVRSRLGLTDARPISDAVVLSIVLVAVVGGVLFTGSALPEAHHGSPSQPQFVDAADEAAMTWIAGHTAPSAQFVVLGDAAEWFPLLTDRTVLVGPWGVEWTSPERYERQLSQYRRLSTCPTAACLNRGLGRAGVDPEYVYVPTDAYTVRGIRYEGTAQLRLGLQRSGRYRLVHRNEGVAVYRVLSGPNESTAASIPSVPSALGAVPPTHSRVSSAPRTPVG